MPGDDAKRFDDAVDSLLSGRLLMPSHLSAFWAYVDGDDEALDGFS
jgi:hypothetical protein